MEINRTIGGVHVKLSTARLHSNIRDAQKALNEMVVADSNPYIPFSQGALRGSVRYPDGIYGGKIMYDSPYAHYQYMGIVYGPNIPIKDSMGNITGWFSPPGKKKYPTDRLLEYHTEGTGSKWFEKAKEKNYDRWVKTVKEIAGKP